MGGYLITDPSNKPSERLYINVCRDIKTVRDDGMHAVLGRCPPGTAACLVKNQHYYSLGQPELSVNITSDNR